MFFSETNASITPKFKLETPLIHWIHHNKINWILKAIKGKKGQDFGPCGLVVGFYFWFSIVAIWLFTLWFQNPPQGRRGKATHNWASGLIWPSWPLKSNLFWIKWIEWIRVVSSLNLAVIDWLVQEKNHFLQMFFWVKYLPDIYRPVWFSSR